MEIYSVERLTAANIGRLVYLYKEVFNQKITVNFLLQKYDTKIFGTEFIGFIALTQSNLPMAFYGVIPCLVQWEGKVILAAQSSDTMTHPNFQRQGLFHTLAMKTYALAKENGIQFIFGFPNQNSYPGFVKLQWQFTTNALQLFKLNTGIPGFGKLMSRIPILKQVYNQYVRRMLGVHNFQFIEVFQPDFTYGIKHDSLFLDYKGYHKTYFKKIENGLLWLKVEGKLHIGFAKLKNSPTPIFFIRKLKWLAISLGCKEVVLMTSKNSELYNLLSQHVQPSDAFPVGFYNLSHEPFAFEKMHFEYCDLDIF